MIFCCPRPFCAALIGLQLPPSILHCPHPFAPALTGFSLPPFVLRCLLSVLHRPHPISPAPVDFAHADDRFAAQPAVCAGCQLPVRRARRQISVDREIHSDRSDNVNGFSIKNHRKIAPTTHRIDFSRDTDRRELDFVVLQDRKPLLGVEWKTGEHAAGSSLCYFAERTAIPHFY